jgi:hypothetical protein
MTAASRGLWSRATSEIGSGLGNPRELGRSPLKRSRGTAMPYSHRERSDLTRVLLVILLVCVGLVACGGSSNDATTPSTQGGAATLPSDRPTTTATTSSSTVTQGRTPAPAVKARAPAKRPKLSQVLTRYSACLHAHGVRPTSGSGHIDLAKIGGAAYKAAAKACTAILTHAFPGTGEPVVRPSQRTGAAPPSRTHLKPALAHALQKFAACMREHGVNLPPPNITKGEIFNTSGLNKNSPQFKSAENACNQLLQGAF